MHPILCSTPTLALSAIYCLYRAYLHAHLRRRRLLHERVAYMLWVMARGPAAPTPSECRAPVAPPRGPRATP
jgi:hypothetical protein